jgi:glycosyltransferase involved in cell wall biosynthesis
VTTLDVCICTHDPRPEILALAIGAVANQTSRGFRFLLVDNASSTLIPEAVLAPIRAAGVPASIVREPVPGIARARLRCIDESRADWILFVDDDNELAPDYVAEGLRFIGSRPDLGCFGGKLLLPSGIRPPRWARSFLPYLAIKDAGEEIVTGTGERWGVWEPPTAGAFVRREVAHAFRARVAEEERIFELGRKGKYGLASCEDSLIMRQTHRLGLVNAYLPRLSLRHHIDPARFRVSYMLQLMRGYGMSHVLLESVIRGESPPRPLHYQGRRFVRLLASEFNSGRKSSIAYGLGRVMYHWGAWSAHRRHEHLEA